MMLTLACSDVRPWPEATKWPWPWPWGLWPWPWPIGLDHIVIVELPHTVAYVMVVK